MSLMYSSNPASLSVLFNGLPVFFIYPRSLRVSLTILSRIGATGLTEALLLSVALKILGEIHTSSSTVNPCFILNNTLSGRTNFSHICNASLTPHIKEYLSILLYLLEDTIFGLGWRSLSLLRILSMDILF
jgi:hypothetical protein